MSAMATHNSVLRTRECQRAILSSSWLTCQKALDVVTESGAMVLVCTGYSGALGWEPR